MFIIEFWFDDGSYKYVTLYGSDAEFDKVLSCLDCYYSKHLSSFKVRFL